MNRKKLLLAASAVVLTVGGVFAGRGIKADPTDLYVLTGSGSIPGDGCIKVATGTGLTINAAFTTSAGGGQQAAIRSKGGTLRLLYQNSNCNQPVYFL